MTKSDALKVMEYPIYASHEAASEAKKAGILGDRQFYGYCLKGPKAGSFVFVYPSGDWIIKTLPKDAKVIA